MLKHKSIRLKEETTEATVSDSLELVGLGEPKVRKVYLAEIVEKYE